MTKLKMKIYKTILAEKQKKHQYCHQGKLINMKSYGRRKIFVFAIWLKNNNKASKVNIFFSWESIWKTNKKIESQGIKEVEAWKALKSEENKQNLKSTDSSFPKEMRTNEI